MVALVVGFCVAISKLGKNVDSHFCGNKATNRSQTIII